MNILKRYKYHLIAALILITLLMVGAKTKINQVQGEATELPQIEIQSQRDHSEELMPHRDAFSSFESREDMRQFILNIVKQSLPRSQKKHAFEIAHAVITEGNHHGFDPLFLLAVIKTESHFNVKARGGHGEIGLMQILPKTAKWLAPQAGLGEKFDLNDPAVNIRLGATYFAKLRDRFDKVGTHYVAAYNMGTGNVLRLLATKTQPKVYPARVLGNYSNLYQSLVTRTVASVKPRMVQIATK